MPAPRTGWRSTTLLPAVLIATVLSSAPAAAAPATQRAAKELAGHCDDLIAGAVRTGFGWGWIDGFDADDAAAPNARFTNKTQPIDARRTARVGILMLLAGELLGEPRYRQAAAEAGRALAAVQTKPGQVRGRGAMGAYTGRKDDVGDIPDRGPTRAAIGLWLALVDATPPGQDREARFAGPAAHASYWLAKQQLPSGAYPIIYPPDAPRGKGNRIIRLDDPDFRDSGLAVLLAGEVLDDKGLRSLAERTITELLQMRVAGPPPAGDALWAAVYDLGGEPTRRYPELGTGLDVVATRHAMELMLATYLLAFDNDADAAVQQAARALAALPQVETKAGKAWHRAYDRRGQPARRAAATQPTSQPAGTVPALEPGQFPRDDGDAPPPDQAGRFGLDALLAAAARVEKAGGEKFERSLPTRLTTRQRIALTVAGVSPDAMTRPARPAGAALDDPPAEPAGELDRRIATMWQSLEHVAAKEPPATGPSTLPSSPPQ